MYLTSITKDLIRYKYRLKLRFLFYPEIYLINLAKTEIKFGWTGLEEGCNIAIKIISNPTFSTMDFVHAIVILKKKLMTKSVSQATYFLSL